MWQQNLQSLFRDCMFIDNNTFTHTPYQKTEACTNTWGWWARVIWLASVQQRMQTSQPMCSGLNKHGVNSGQNNIKRMGEHSTVRNLNPPWSAELPLPFFQPTSDETMAISNWRMPWWPSSLQLLSCQWVNINTVEVGRLHTPLFLTFTSSKHFLS